MPPAAASCPPVAANHPLFQRPTGSRHQPRIVSWHANSRSASDGSNGAHTARTSRARRRQPPTGSGGHAGLNAPAVDAARSLAAALGTTIEKLFAEEPPQQVRSALGGRVRDGAPLRVGRVAEQLVAAEVPDHRIAGASWGYRDGVPKAAKLQLFPSSNGGGGRARWMRPRTRRGRGAAGRSRRREAARHLRLDGRAPRRARSDAAASTRQAHTAPRTTLPPSSSGPPLPSRARAHPRPNVPMEQRLPGQNTVALWLRCEPSRRP
jgi:hypothetical protein